MGKRTIKYFLAWFSRFETIREDAQWGDERLGGMFYDLSLVALLRKSEHPKDEEGETTSLKMEEEDCRPEPCSCLRPRSRAGWPSHCGHGTDRSRDDFLTLLKSTSSSMFTRFRYSQWRLSSTLEAL